MNARRFAVVTCGVALLGAVAAQERPNDRSPVPTRILTQRYGYDTGNPSGLQVECSLWGERGTTLRVSNGKPGTDVVLLASHERAEMVIPGAGTLLVSPSAIPIVGTLDATGMFERRIAVDRLALNGHSFYFQAVELRVAPPVERSDPVGWSLLSMKLSLGLEIRFLPGNPQPALGYEGPPLTSIPCKAVGELIPTLWAALLEFEVRGVPYVMDQVYVRPVDRETQAIMVVLRRRDGAADPAVIGEVVDLGPSVKPRVEVWVAVVEPGDACVVFARAAEMYTDY